MSDKVVVKQSAIHGLGLFASRSIDAGELIGAIEPRPVRRDGPHVLWVSENEGHRVDGPLKYINHSPDPNACYCDDLTVIALRDIRPGEEITHDYGDDWEDG